MTPPKLRGHSCVETRTFSFLIFRMLLENPLLGAAHIVPDANEQLGQPVVPNGLPLSKIHHAAFDAYLIGIDPDYRVHVADRLLEQHDGKMLEALKLLDGGQIHLPRQKWTPKFAQCPKV